MDDLNGRLESLFRRYAAALGQSQVDHATVAKQFLEDVDFLIAQFGQPAINAALDEAPGRVPSISLH
jgi:hypothetical protein